MNDKKEFITMSSGPEGNCIIVVRLSELIAVANMSDKCALSLMFRHLPGSTTLVFESREEKKNAFRYLRDLLTK